ncbi:TniQ family protein (plasmid) [Chromobacterium amazonense]|uniref:TniQ family protein n=1 Tax=Chromobacterium amazonense TaxID=1382803 RepID=UPI00237DD147|nr:TniQ family protein [Chromobacterium amazonense]MDE1712702.1 TniQ family protein [Chromobacterium amazonense]
MSTLYSALQLLARPTPDPAEQLAGYLLRLADMNCLRHPQELCQLLQSTPDTKVRASLVPQVGVYDLAPLARSTGYEIEQLEKLTRPLDVRVGRFRHFEYQGRRWPLSIIRSKYRAWCPLCLRTKGKQLASWDWHVTTYCPEHQVLLVEHCPACNKRVSWRHSSLYRCACGAELARAPRVSATTAIDGFNFEALPHDEQLRHIALTYLFLSENYPEANLTTLLAAPIPDIHAMISQISNSDLTRRKGFESTVQASLDRRYAKYPGFGPRFAALPALRGTALEPELDQQLFVLAETWVNAQSSKPIFEESGYPAITIAGVASTLNVSNHVVRTLLNKGLLQQASLAPTQPFPDKRCVAIDGDSLVELQRLLTPARVGESNMTGVSFARFGIDHATRLDLIKAIKTKETRVLAYDHRVGLPSLVLEKPTEPPSHDGTLSVKEAAQQLGIYTDAIYRVVKQGLLRHQTLPRRSVRIQAQALEAFHQKYVFVRELAKMLACNATNLADRLINVGIQPVHGPTIDGGLVYLFRRADITPAVLGQVATAPHYKSRCGRGHKQQIGSADATKLTPREACSLLGIPLRHLEKLCSSGFLTPLQQDTKSSQPVFNRNELEQYKARYIGNDDWLDHQQASGIAEKLGMSFRHLLRIPGLLPAENNGICTVFSKEKLLSAIQFRQSTITLKELASISQLNPKTIKREATSGCLQAEAIMIDGKQPRLFFLHLAVEKLKSSAAVKKSAIANKMGEMSDAGLS